MKAIQIKYLPPTSKRAPRLKVWTLAGVTITPCPEGSLIEEQARLAAIHYAARLGWPRPCGFGVIDNGDWVATMEPIL